MERTERSLLARTPIRTWVSLGLLALGLYDLAYLVRWGMSTPLPPFGDFFGLWSFGRFAHANGRLIYDPVALANYQHALNPAVHGSFPFPYPPTFLLAVIPLAFMPLPVAYGVWIASTGAACLLATLGKAWRSIYGFGLLVVPTTLLTITSGQNGFLSAALLVGGLNSLKTKPLLAGVLLGLLTYKPQFVLLLPVILIACGNRAALLACGLTAACSIVTTSLLFGWAIWPSWIAGFPAYQKLLSANQANLDHLMPTVLAGMHMLGAPAALGYILYAVVALAVAALCWRALSRGITDRAIAMAIVGSFLVAPYAMVYDTPMIASAVVLHWKSRRASGHTIGLWEVTLVIATFACLLDMISAALPLVAPLLILGVFLLITLAPKSPQTPAASA